MPVVFTAALIVLSHPVFCRAIQTTHHKNLCTVVIPSVQWLLLEDDDVSPKALNWQRTSSEEP